jgi:hypothetical protein
VWNATSSRYVAHSRAASVRDEDGKLDVAQLGAPWRRLDCRTTEKAARVTQATAAKQNTIASVDAALRLFEQQAAAVSERVLNGASC